ncbi:unnamed protein product [Rhodiola kirilowii]
MNVLVEASDVAMCDAKNPDDVWYKKMETCVTPYHNEAAIVEWKPFPERLNLVPARVTSGFHPRSNCRSIRKGQQSMEEACQCLQKD